MKQLKIGLDFDGVIADCGRLKTEGARQLYGLEIPSEKFKKEIVIGEGLLDKEQYLHLQQTIYGTREIGLLMEAVEEVNLYLPKLAEDGHDIRVITSRGTVETEIAREWAAGKQIDLRIEGVGGASKATAAEGLDVYVDDDLDKLESLVGVVPELFLFSWGYNADVESDGVASRVSNWAELYQKLRNIAAT